MGFGGERKRIADYVNAPVKELFAVTVENTPLSANSAVGIIASLGSELSSAFKAGIVKENPLARYALPKIGKIEIDIIDDQIKYELLKRHSDGKFRRISA
jgi:hypothetical protein